MSWISSALGAIGKAVAPVGSALVSGIGSIVGGAMSNSANAKAVNATNETNLRIAQENNASNAKLAQQQNQWNIDQWNRENAYNDPAQQASRMANAGFNPAGSVMPNDAGSLQSAELANQQVGSPMVAGTTADVVTPAIASALAGAQLAKTNAETDTIVHNNKFIDDMALSDLDLRKVNLRLQEQLFKHNEVMNPLVQKSQELRNNADKWNERLNQENWKVMMANRRLLEKELKWFDKSKQAEIEHISKQMEEIDNQIKNRDKSTAIAQQNADTQQAMKDAQVGLINQQETAQDLANKHTAVVNSFLDFYGIDPNSDLARNLIQSPRRRLLLKNALIKARKGDYSTLNPEENEILHFYRERSAIAGSAEGIGNAISGAVGLKGLLK